LTDVKALVDSAKKRAEDDYAKQRKKEAKDGEKKSANKLVNLTNSVARRLAMGSLGRTGF